MNTSSIASLSLAALLGGGAALPAQAVGQVEVSYVKPDEFRDAGRFAVDRQRTMNALTQYLQELGKQLPDGQTLRLEVTDIDLAGETYPGRSLEEPRVLRGGADWPQLWLRYTLVDASGTLKSGEVRLSDPAYLFFNRSATANSGDLTHEKRMLRQWFDEKIVAAAQR